MHLFIVVGHQTKCYVFSSFLRSIHVFVAQYTSLLNSFTTHSSPDMFLTAALVSCIVKASTRSSLYPRQHLYYPTPLFLFVEHSEHGIVYIFNHWPFFSDIDLKKWRRRHQGMIIASQKVHPPRPVRCPRPYQVLRMENCWTLPVTKGCMRTQATGR